MRSPNRIVELMAAPRADHDIDWLKASLQAAIELEFATIPPYLCGYWSIKDGMHPAAMSIREVIREEMLHFGLACNMLAGIGGRPALNQPSAVPDYPGPLPGGVIPDLLVTLAGLSKKTLELFMAIERPDFDPFGEPREIFASIADFYAAIESSFDTVRPTVDGTAQLEGPLGLRRLGDLDAIREAIALITTQGEGSEQSPEETPGDLAHYYRFAELYHGRKLIKRDGAWTYSGREISFPDVWPMAAVPKGGYAQGDVEPAVWDDVSKFDQRFTTMLNQLQDAWSNGNGGALIDSTGTMFSLRGPAVQLMQVPIPAGGGNYGPCFRLA
jgi:hypothetical protein